jgi:hypothetical protein
VSLLAVTVASVDIDPALAAMWDTCNVLPVLVSEEWAEWALGAVTVTSDSLAATVVAVDIDAAFTAMLDVVLRVSSALSRWSVSVLAANVVAVRSDDLNVPVVSY